MSFTNEQIRSHVNSLQGQGLTGNDLYSRMYDDARANGVTSSQIDNAMGYQSGETNDWTSSMGVSALPTSTTNSNGRELNVYGSGASSRNTSLPVTNSGTTTPLTEGGLLEMSALPGGSNAGHSSNTNNGFTEAEILGHIDGLQQQGLTGVDLENQIYLDANQFGVSAERLEAVMGWDAGTVRDWTRRNGVAPLQDARHQNARSDSTGWQTSPYVAPALNEVQDASTVQSQLDQVLSTDSPLMQRAAYRGRSYANSRGLLNSSLAAGSAQAAMIDAALPIAQQDAQTYFGQQNTNQGYENQYNLTNLGHLQQLGLLEVDQQFNSRENQLQRDQQQGMQASELGSSMAVERLKQNSGLYAQFLQGMSDINGSDMDQGAKDTAMASLWDAITQGTEMATSLSAVTFENGQLVYANTSGNIADTAAASGVLPSQPTPDQSNQTMMVWGQPGIYTSGITRNSQGQIVDAEGNTAPSSSHQLSNGAWEQPRLNEWDYIGGR